MTNFEMVREFHERFGHPVNTVPQVPADDALCDLRMDLIAEEFQELKDADCRGGPITEVADALTDMLYVIYGMGHVYGINLDKCFGEVHRSNMSKLGSDGKPILRPDGKIMKGESYSPPDLATVMGIKANS